MADIASHINNDEPFFYQAEEQLMRGIFPECVKINSVVKIIAYIESVIYSVSSAFSYSSGIVQILAADNFSCQPASVQRCAYEHILNHTYFIQLPEVIKNPGF
jgi:hypothetical protein